jgi:hypothetical protein
MRFGRDRRGDGMQSAGEGVRFDDHESQPFDERSTGRAVSHHARTASKAVRVCAVHDAFGISARNSKAWKKGMTAQPPRQAM